MFETTKPSQTTTASKNHAASRIVTPSPENATSGLAVLNGPGQYSHSNILRLQQTIGNQAVMRMLSNRSNSATTTSPHPGAIQRSVAPTNVIQRKGSDLKVKDLAPTLSGGLVNSSWSKIHTAFKDYMVASDPEKEVHYLKKLQDLIDEWKSKSGNANKNQKGTLIVRLETMIAEDLPKAMAKAIGLPPELIENLDQTALNGLADAALYLEKGVIEKAEAVLKSIEGSIPGFTLIKSMLVRRYIGNIHPELGEAMNNPKFSNSPEHLSGNAKPPKPGDKKPAVIDPYEEERGKSDKYGLKTGSTYEGFYFRKKRNENLDEYQSPKMKITPEEREKRQKEAVTKMFKRKHYTRLGFQEVRALTAYSAGTYKAINPFLRSNILPGDITSQANQGNQNKPVTSKEDYEDSTAGTGHLIEDSMAGNGNLKDSMAGTGHLIEDSFGGNAEMNGNSSQEDDLTGRDTDLNEHENMMANADMSGEGSEEDSAGRFDDLNVNAPEVADASETDDDADRPEDEKNGNGNGDAIQQGSIPFTKTAISALNKLKPYKGKVYRNAKLFPGYSEVNKVGAVVTDLGFTSSTYLAGSLRTEFGKDIMEIIQSKNGKFIKPISLVAKEDEVLFKPGTRFKVTKRYDADSTKAEKERWPASLDSEVQKALLANPAGPEIKIVVIKEEV